MSVFDDAIVAHADWKRKLINYAKGDPNLKLNPIEVGKDNCCQFAQRFLYGPEGKEAKTKHPELFQELLDLHKKFHQSAANVVSMIDRKKTADAQKDIEDGEFHKSAQQVVLAIGKLRRAA